ncbi:MAG: hypothetical protein HY816_18585 [Candidatus Wallbacteria bacterium]|nr:hypothetical protein [Candidatus Wallbacteria bacterium]
MRDRRGMVIYLAAGLAFTAALFIFTYYGFMRNQTQQAQVLLQGEMAYYLAQSGVAAGIAHFLNTKSETTLHRALTAGDSAQANAAPAEKLQVDKNAALTSLLEQQEGVLEVEMSLAGFKPAYVRQESESGIRYNTVEKIGWLKVVSTASVGPARRRIVAFKQVRVVCTVPYVVGKFTLLELEGAQPAANALNRFQLEKTGMLTGRPSDTNPLLPVVFHHGAGSTPEEKGWVFLGGGPRRLNLAWGRQGDGEEFHLLEKPWKVTSDPLAPTPLPADFQLLIMEKGFFGGIHADNNLFDGFDFQAPAADPPTENAGLLYLYGIDGDRAPTYVLGEVWRRFLSLRYVSRKSDGQYTYLPWARPSDWGPGDKPWASPPPWDVRGETFGGSFDSYAYSMSQVVEEPYNRSADFITQLQTEVDLPRTLVSPGRVRHRFGLADFLYRPALNNGDVIVSGADGVRLFDGNLHGLLMEDFYFKERATYRLPAADFESFMALANPRIPGILHFEGGDVRIDRPLTVKDGGILAVDGKVTIAAPVRVSEGRRPLVLASLTGDIVIATGQPVEAYLMALAGRITGTGTGVNLTGGVAAGSVDWGSVLAQGQRSRIGWNPAADPTNPENSIYSVHVSPPRESYMPGGVN